MYRSNGVTEYGRKQINQINDNNALNDHIVRKESGINNCSCPCLPWFRHRQAIYWTKPDKSPVCLRLRRLHHIVDDMRTISCSPQ